MTRRATGPIPATVSAVAQGLRYRAWHLKPASNRDE
jgi:hypothetical protein